MTEASIPPQPTQSPSDVADLDDLVIEDLTDASWKAVAPRICICTFGAE